MSDFIACSWYQRETVTANAKSLLATRSAQHSVSWSGGWTGKQSGTLARILFSPLGWRYHTATPEMSSGPEQTPPHTPTAPSATSKVGSQNVLGKEASKETHHAAHLLVPPPTFSKQTQSSPPAKHSPDACFQAPAEAFWSLLKHFRRLFH